MTLNDGTGLEIPKISLAILTEIISLPENPFVILTQPL